MRFLILFLFILSSSISMAQVTERGAAFLEILENKFSQDQMNPDEFLKYVEQVLNSQELEPKDFMSSFEEHKIQLTKVKRNGTQLKVQLFIIPPGASEAPHLHENGLFSIQRVLHGKIHFRSFQLNSLGQERAHVTAAVSRELEPRDLFYTTPSLEQAHWFGNSSNNKEYAFVLNINVRGFDSYRPNPYLEHISKTTTGRYYLNIHELPSSIAESAEVSLVGMQEALQQTSVPQVPARILSCSKIFM